MSRPVRCEDETGRLRLDLPSSMVDGRITREMVRGSMAVLRAVYLRLWTCRPFVLDRYVRLNPQMLEMANW